MRLFLVPLLLITVNRSMAERPNLIYIMADDLGWGDLGCYGQQRIQTPKLDRMAAEGMRFTQVYAGSTVCAPSRSVLMTGLHTGHTRVRGNARVPLLPEDVTVAEVLKQQGYHTALIGKWGLGEPGTTGMPTRQGFDYFYGYLNQRHAHNYYPSHLWRNETRVELKNKVPDEDAVGGGVSENKLEYSHDLFAKEALSYITEHTEQPFFLYLSLTIPHANNQAGKKGMEVPDFGVYTDLEWPEPQKGHAAMISLMDQDMGRILALLKSLNLDEKTIVFFTSDNGPHREGGNNPDFNDSNGPLRGIKRSMHDGGIRVPMIVRWPGHVQGGEVNDTVWYFADFLPTAAELTGATIPSGLDGVSIMPTLLGQPQDLSDRMLYWEFHERGFKQAVRWGSWKGVRAGSGKPLQLFHLTADVAEQNELALQNPSIASRLERFLDLERTPSRHWPLKP
jgi:arylsulfatase A-like enzyme